MGVRGAVGSSGSGEFERRREEPGAGSGTLGSAARVGAASASRGIDGGTKRGRGRNGDAASFPARSATSSPTPAPSSTTSVTTPSAPSPSRPTRLWGTGTSSPAASTTRPPDCTTTGRAGTTRRRGPGRARTRWGSTPGTRACIGTSETTRRTRRTRPARFGDSWNGKPLPMSSFSSRAGMPWEQWEMRSRTPSKASMQWRLHRKRGPASLKGGTNKGFNRWRTDFKPKRSSATSKVTLVLPQDLR